MKNLLPYLQSQRWFFGIRAQESLFFYSAKYLDRERLLKKEYETGLVETVLFPRAQDYPVRVFNLAQTKLFHAESEQKLLADYHIVETYLSRDRKLWEKIRQTTNFDDLLRLYGEYGTLFYINFSLGMTLARLLNEGNITSEAQEVLHQHEFWRNNVAALEETLGGVFFDLLKGKFPKIDTLELMKYATAEEIQNESLDLATLIEKRKRDGYVYTYLRDETFRGVIDDVEEIGRIQEYFINLIQQDENGQEIKGQVAFKSDVKVRGRVVLIEDKYALEKSKPDLTGAILVAIQTTPQYVPYLKGVKAIVTDEGGITCHAAIISRELKIPCIVGTKNATKLLKDGDEVEVDTGKGEVRKI